MRVVFRFSFAVLLLAAAYVANISHVAAKEIHIVFQDPAIGSQIASGVGGYPLGTGAWANNTANTSFLFLPMDEMFGNQTNPANHLNLSTISHMGWQTNQSAAGPAVDWFTHIYTLDAGAGTAAGEDSSWYAHRITFEPTYSDNITAPANTWNTWTTAPSATNELNVFDPVHKQDGNAAVLSDVQTPTPGINWSLFTPGTADGATVDYTAEVAEVIVIATGSSWTGTFTGSLDNWTMTAGNDTITVDFESHGLGDVDGNGYVGPSDHTILAGIQAGGAVGTNSPDVDGIGGVGDSEDSRVLAEDILHYSKGDTDLDGDIDNTDLGTSIGNFTNAGGSGKYWALGDTDGDADVDNTDLGFSIGNFTGPLLDLLADKADLIYDPLTGNVKLDASEAAGAIITNFVLQDIGGAFNAPGTANFPFVSLQTDLTTEISNTDGTLVGFSGIHDLGNILPSGLDLANLTALLDASTYVGMSGSGVQELDLVLVAEAVVPEPGTFSLLVLGLLGLIRSRRRRRA